VCHREVRPAGSDNLLRLVRRGLPGFEHAVRAARVGLVARSRHELAEHAARKALRKIKGAVLSECDRRRLWNGHRRGILEECADVTNLARIGREFLTRIGQVPDWTKVLKRRGDPGLDRRTG